MLEWEGLGPGKFAGGNVHPQTRIVVTLTHASSEPIAVHLHREIRSEIIVREIHKSFGQYRGPRAWDLKRLCRADLFPTLVTLLSQTNTSTYLRHLPILRSRCNPQGPDPLLFFGVEGLQENPIDTPSFWNTAEAEKVSLCCTQIL